MEENGNFFCAMINTNHWFLNCYINKLKLVNKDFKSLPRYADDTHYILPDPGVCCKATVIIKQANMLHVVCAADLEALKPIKAISCRDPTSNPTAVGVGCFSWLTPLMCPLPLIIWWSCLGPWASAIMHTHAKAEIKRAEGGWWQSHEICNVSKTCWPQRPVCTYAQRTEITSNA